MGVTYKDLQGGVYPPFTVFDNDEGSSYVLLGVDPNGNVYFLYESDFSLYSHKDELIDNGWSIESSDNEFRASCPQYHLRPRVKIDEEVLWE